ncbi:Chaperone required for the assembly of the F1-ATPase [Arboricoccus pini]|uniref:Chaperone required for the assembly of the F1-ATPase n=1 Tax=Arboricoccus pini TaxID=1963835 RepID=A0A212QPL9_9PROT|nr:ATP12 family protein [Arboricoccus pini]SNB61370.1 Chaperone required for the assembly of the F1-ATPase [Arboricoccus pini]
MAKRFYKDVQASAAEDGFAILLDGRPLRTPVRRVLILPTRALADLVAEEWAAQAKEIVPDSMPLTRLATTVLDLMPTRRTDAEAEILGYGETDLLCYRAAHPQDLAARQAEAWQKWLDWAHLHLDSRLVTTTGIAAIQQDEGALCGLKRAVKALDDWRLTALHAATSLMGSIILGLALQRGALTPAEGFEAAVLDELYEMERWGEEADLLQRHARLRRDLEAVSAFLAALG